MLTLKRLLALAFAALIASPVAALDAIEAEAMAKLLAAKPAPLLLDVRSEEEFAQGHLPGARLIPHDQIAERLAELGAPGEIYIYCRSGRRTKIAAVALEQAGFSVHEIAGSYQAWQAAELPIERPSKDLSNKEKTQ